MSSVEKTKGRYSLPIPVGRSLRKLGQDIRSARLRRRIKTATLAERAGTSRFSLQKIEKGDPGVSIGIYACVLFSLGMIDRLADLLDVRHDDLGLMLDEEKLPERIRGLPKDSKTKAKP
jgi:DNA-binding XRE family transcriptional regulator